MAEKVFFPFSLGQKRGFSHFVLHVKRRHRSLEVKRLFNLYWRAELNFGQEPVFLEAILRTNRARCTLNKEILIYSTRKAFLECTVVELVYKFNEKSTASV